MLQISKLMIERIYKHAVDAAPVEACGYLAGIGTAVKKMYTMYNIDQSTDHFSLDPAEQLKVIKDARSQGLEILAVYHTHPTCEAVPSEEDIRLANDPQLIYVIASLCDDKNARAYRIIDGKVEELGIEII